MTLTYYIMGNNIRCTLTCTDITVLFHTSFNKILLIQYVWYPFIAYAWTYYIFIVHYDDSDGNCINNISSNSNISNNHVGEGCSRQILPVAWGMQYFTKCTIYGLTFSYLVFIPVTSNSDYALMFDLFTSRRPSPSRYWVYNINDDVLLFWFHAIFSLTIKLSDTIWTFIFRLWNTVANVYISCLKECNCSYR